MPEGKPRILVLSCNETPWGGSEELWARSALRLVENGAYVRIAKPHIDPMVPALQALATKDVTIADLARIGFLPYRLAALLRNVFRPASTILQLLPLWWQIWRTKPHLVVLSQGGNWDGFHMGWLLNKLKIPYALICQKATDLYWPPDFLRARVTTLAIEARHIFFVSHHNHRLFEEQIGARLHHASVVRNPFLVDYAEPLPWPEDEGPTRLACVGRLYPMEKGQDMLLRVLALPKWRERNLIVNLYGAGPNAEGLKAMARYLECDNVVFMGHVDDVEAIWRDHHALVLPSRAEGLPLVLVEAMLTGRVAVVSTAGGSGEVVDDNITGFLMQGQDEAALDEALERAWQARDRWQGIGAEAAMAIRQQVPPDPAETLALHILQLCDEMAGAQGKPGKP